MGFHRTPKPIIARVDGSRTCGRAFSWAQFHLQMYFQKGCLIVDDEERPWGML